MKTTSESLSNDIVAALTSLHDGVDTKTLDVFLDHLFELANRNGLAVCELANNDALCVKSPNLGESVMVEMPRALTKMRMVCARLAVRCSKSCSREIKPYGDSVEFACPDSGVPFKVQFTNTTSRQEISIELVKRAIGV